MRAHGTLPVTSVAWRQRLPAEGGGGTQMLVSSGADGAVRLWRLTGDQVGQPLLPVWGETDCF